MCAIGDTSGQRAKHIDNRSAASLSDGGAVIAGLCATLAALWAADSPIAGQDAAGRQALAHRALRRWRTFSRRHPVAPQGLARQIEDLAKGVRESTMSDRRSVGPLMADYRHAAAALAVVLRDNDGWER